MTEKEFDNKWNSRYKERVSSDHYTPSPETRERLATLETNQTFMVQEITEIKQLVKGLDNKLDTVIACKADKSEVEKLSDSVRDLEGWKIKIIAIGSVVIFILTFLKDPIIEFIKQL